jgi:copper chaperone CopZ
MKHLRIAFAMAAFTAAIAVRADEIKLSNVHLCCTACVKGAEKAAAKAAGATVTVDKDAGTVAISSGSKAGIQQAVDALVAAGYYGKPSDASVKVDANTGATDGKVQTLKLEGVHLCCGKCVTAVQTALGKVPGVKGNTAEKNAKVFEVTGDFSSKAVFDALHNAGLTGKVAK